MQNIKVLDVTLRDGGCVINFDFGQAYIDKILDAQEKSDIEIIELGYLDDKKGSEHSRTQYINEKVIEKNIIKSKKENISYVAMMDYGKYDVDTLGDRTPNGIDGIRLAFHKKNYRDIIDVGRKIISKGYDLYIQPMLTLRYSDYELIELLNLVNDELNDTKAFYIVDSFGEMREGDVIRLFCLINEYLNDNMSIGFHSHNNLQLSYSNTISLINVVRNRDVIIDSSIMGMGKGAGNLNTELLLEHLNLFYNKHYSVEPLLNVVDTVLNQIHSEHYWGYSVEYYLSSTNHCSPTYASHFYNKHMLPVAMVNELLAQIEDDKKISFDIKYADWLYYEYNQKNEVIDDRVIQLLAKDFENKEVLLVAPGKSILHAKDIIEEISSKEEVVTLGLNVGVGYNFDYILTTRKEVYDELKLSNKNIICPSNIVKDILENVKVISYKKWTNIDGNGKTHDSSFAIIANILIYFKIKKLYLAGFDGVSLDISKNYYENDMRRPLSRESAKQFNEEQVAIINKLKKNNIEILFLTETNYS